MKSNATKMILLSLAACLSIPALAGLPTTNDPHFTNLEKAGFYPHDLSVVTPLQSNGRIFVARDSDLNLHFAYCKQSKLEDGANVDWQSLVDPLNNGQVQDITVNTAIFGTVQSAGLHDVLNNLKPGGMTLLRTNDKNGTLIECDATDSFTQQEFMTISEQYNATHGWKALAENVATTYAKDGIILGDLKGAFYIATAAAGYSDCKPDPFQPFFRVQVDVTVHAPENSGACSEYQGMTGSQFGLIYPSDHIAFAKDLHKLRKMLTQWKTAASESTLDRVKGLLGGVTHQ